MVSLFEWFILSKRTQPLDDLEQSYRTLLKRVDTLEESHSQISPSDIFVGNQVNNNYADKLVVKLYEDTSNDIPDGTELTVFDMKGSSAKHTYRTNRKVIYQFNKTKTTDMYRNIVYHCIGDGSVGTPNVSTLEAEDTQSEYEKIYNSPYLDYESVHSVRSGEDRSTFHAKDTDFVIGAIKPIENVDVNMQAGRVKCLIPMTNNRRIYKVIVNTLLLSTVKARIMYKYCVKGLVKCTAKIVNNNSTVITIIVNEPVNSVFCSNKSLLCLDYTASSIHNIFLGKEEYNGTF